MGRKPSAEWSSITDQAERRRAQNRLAQRKKRQRDTESGGPSSSTVASPADTATESVDGTTDQVETPNIFQNGPGITTEIGKLESPTFLYSPNQLVLDGLGSALPRDASLPGSANFVRVRSHDGAPSAASQAPQLSSAVESQNFHWSVEVPPELHSSWDDRSHHLRPAGGGPSSASAQHVRPDAYSNLNLIPDRTLKRKSPSFAFNRATTELPQGLQSQQTNASNADMSSFQPSVEDGICKMISLARSLGFESLDSMMLQYYTHSFEENASAVEVQGRSRRRGLPALLSHLSRAARGWPRREAQGFEEALLASVEHIVRREADSYAGARTSEARFKDVAPPENRASNVKSLRTDLPNTWTILYELATSFLSSEEEASEFVRIAMAELVLKE